jgi:poly-beta-1,6-N-acetyl-D-glucosamine synthase
VGGYEDNLQIASGDDEFLMRKVNMKYPHGSIFIGAKNAIVTTRPQATFYDFMQQRIRWASKWRFSTSIESKSLALLVLGVQMACIGALVGCLFFYEPIFPVLLITKAGLEAIFLIRVCKFLDTRWSWPAFFVLQLLYPFYVVLVGILSNLLSFRWKGRMHQ